ncbi:MAG: NifU family protein [Phycisphaerae bacterium]|nr:NifU family protein [Phycisphaerae bacterium]
MIAEADSARDPKPEDLVAAVDRARRRADGFGDEPKAAVAAFTSALEAFHAEALRRIVRRLRADERGKELLFELVDDPLVHAAMLTLGIVKPDVVVRVARAIERVRPYAQSHGGDVELVRVEAKVAYVRMHGACSGCSASAQTLSESVETAVKAVAPEIERVEAIADRPVVGLVTLTVKADEAPSERHGWVAGPSVDELAESRPTRVLNEGCDVLLVRRGERVFAYRNSCPHQGMPLDDGMLSDDGVLMCPWHGLQFDVCSGECVNEPSVQLEPLPLKIHERVVWIRPNGVHA